MANKLGETSDIIPSAVWRDAEARLGLMEEQTSLALSGKWKMTAILVAQEPEYVSPILLPDYEKQTVVEPIKAILGPDGTPLS